MAPGYSSWLFLQHHNCHHGQSSPTSSVSHSPRQGPKVSTLLTIKLAAHDRHVDNGQPVSTTSKGHCLGKYPLTPALAYADHHDSNLPALTKSQTTRIPTPTPTMKVAMTTTRIDTPPRQHPPHRPLHHITHIAHHLLCHSRRGPPPQ